MANTIILNSDASIGNISAETDDEFLFKCFVDHPALALVQDMQNSKMFLLGSTGIGKTAILRMIGKNAKNCQFLELDEMAMNYIVNSDTIQFLQKIDVDLSLFFQSLWKHVLCIEFVKMAVAPEDEKRLKILLKKYLIVTLRTEKKKN